MTNPDLDAIKARHADLKKTLHQPRRKIFHAPPDVRLEQLGLHGVMVDELNRLWRVDCQPMVCIFDPAAR